MTPIYMNRALDDNTRRERIFGGAFFLYSAPTSGVRLVEWARELIDAGFVSVADPRLAHRELSVDQFAARAGPIKSRFTNDPVTKEICQRIITDMGADPERTYFDLPRLRIIPPSSYLSSGVSYNYAAHRDTWYAHPAQLINYWVPVFDVEPETVMSMYVEYFQRPVKNASIDWDYDAWVKNSRFAAATNIKKEERPHPLPLEKVVDSADIRIVQNAGDLFMFSTCQLHASVPNHTDVVRFSYDMRTLNIDDYLAGRGPQNVDSGATGSTLNEFLRVKDLAPLDPEQVAR